MSEPTADQASEPDWAAVEAASMHRTIESVAAALRAARAQALEDARSAIEAKLTGHDQLDCLVKTIDGCCVDCNFEGATAEAAAAIRKLGGEEVKNG